MSPEVRNHDPYSFNTDCWSIGCVTYELITLKKFNSKRICTDEEIQREIKSLRTLDEFKNLLCKMLQIEREKRVQSNELKLMI